MAPKYLLTAIVSGALAVSSVVQPSHGQDGAASAPPPPPPASPTSAPAAPAADPNAGWEESSPGVFVKITSLTRTKHSTVKLRYRFKNSTSAVLGSGALPGAGSYHMNEVFIRHIPSRIEFKPLYSSASGYFASDNAEIPPGGEYIGWAEYPSPPASVTEMTIAFGKFTVDDVPLR